MNRSNYSNLADPSTAAAVRTAAMARIVAGSLIVNCILAVASLTACQPQRGTASRAVDASASQAAPQPTDAGLDTQLRLDPGEIQLYTQNVHG